MAVIVSGESHPGMQPHARLHFDCVMLSFPFKLTLPTIVTPIAIFPPKIKSSIHITYIFMVIPVVEFSREGYKIRKFFG